MPLVWAARSPITTRRPVVDIWSVPAHTEDMGQSRHPKHAPSSQGGRYAQQPRPAPAIDLNAVEHLGDRAMDHRAAADRRLDQRAIAQLLERHSAQIVGVAEGDQVELIQVHEALAGVDPHLPVIHDRGGHPGELTSFRGFYDELALDPYGDSGTTVGELRSTLVCAVGETFTGYKGGEFTMGWHTPLWLCQYGTSSGSPVRGVVVTDEAAILVTDPPQGDTSP